MLSTTSSFSSFSSFASPLAPHPATTAGPCQPAPDALRVNSPTLSTAFHTLLKVAATVDGDGPQTRQRLDHIAVEKHQIEVSDRFDRDVSEDGAVGACIAATDGERREQARQLAIGALAVARQVTDAAVLGLDEDVSGD